MFGSHVSESPTFRDQKIDKSNNSRVESRGSNRSNRSNNSTPIANSTPIVIDLELQEISRAYGLWRNEFNNDKIKSQIEWIKINKKELHNSLMNKLLDISPSSDEEVNNNKVFFQQLKIDYSIRRFEIEQATIHVTKCDICTKSEVKPGIFMELLGSEPRGVIVNANAKNIFIKKL